MRNAMDGIFWMPWQSFCKYFNSWELNKYHEQHQFSAAVSQDKPAVGYHLVTVHVQDAGDYTFGISQCSNGMMPRSARYQYSSVRAILVKARQLRHRDNTASNDQGPMPQQSQSTSLAGCRFLKGVVGEKRDVYIELENGLGPGIYYLFVQVWWDPSSRHLPTREISVNCYGSSRVKFGQDVAPAYDRVEVLTEIFSAKTRQEFATNRKPELVCRSRGRPNAHAIHEYYNRTCPEGYHFRLFSNTEIPSVSNIVLLEDKKFTALQGAELVKPASNSADYQVSGENAYSIRVRPGQTEGVFLMVKSTFGMAGPSGKASIVLPGGRSEPEKESQQTAICKPEEINLPSNTGIQQSAAPVENLISLYVGGSKSADRGGGRRSSSVVQFVWASMRGSIALQPPPAASPTKPKADSSTNNRRRQSSIFGGRDAKKSQGSAVGLISTPATPPTSPTNVLSLSSLATAEPTPLTPLPSQRVLDQQSNPLASLESPSQSGPELNSISVEKVPTSTPTQPSNRIAVQPSRTAVAQPSSTFAAQSSTTTTTTTTTEPTPEQSNITASHASNATAAMSSKDACFSVVNEPFLGAVRQFNKLTPEDDVVLIIDETPEAKPPTTVQSSPTPKHHATAPIQLLPDEAVLKQHSMITTQPSRNIYAAASNATTTKPSNIMSALSLCTTAAEASRSEAIRQLSNPTAPPPDATTVDTSKRASSRPAATVLNEPFLGTVRHFNKEVSEDNVALIIEETSPAEPDQHVLHQNQVDKTPVGRQGFAGTSTKEPEGPKPRKGVQKSPLGFFARVFGDGGPKRSKRKGRKPTSNEEEILASFPELRSGSILENTKTTTKTTVMDGATERVLSIVTTTTLRIII